jgi:hypothetical protein
MDMVEYLSCLGLQPEKKLGGRLLVSVAIAGGENAILQDQPQAEPVASPGGFK